MQMPPKGPHAFWLAVQSTVQRPLPGPPGSTAEKLSLDLMHLSPAMQSVLALHAAPSVEVPGAPPAPPDPATPPPDPPAPLAPARPPLPPAPARDPPAPVPPVPGGAPPVIPAPARPVDPPAPAVFVVVEPAAPAAPLEPRGLTQRCEKQTRPVSHCSAALQPQLSAPSTHELPVAFEEQATHRKPRPTVARPPKNNCLKFITSFSSYSNAAERHRCLRTTSVCLGMAREH